MQMILFKMNQQHYLISADLVEEVVDTIAITQVPLAPEWVEGLINLRGTVITVVNLATLINVAESSTNKNILVLNHEGNRKGLLIEEVMEVLDIEEHDIQLSGINNDSHFVGVVAVEDVIANVIDVAKLSF
ncbi:chemotaxis protein CheW [Periweissella fabalis]|uniref:Purine-binding chemotaxis protein CheW n=1 Tax=Periweissella fabalis TaxID=1070421 RepID=A0A7X6N2B8_9LACO|nr:chemotaxis protein CheW [Periweissella fabalis]MCM0599951.1 purine-binding chemotaxis protein CheW [Periweissella fabalis]NKZ23994.1 purine-binding chemotaxis protein CheW [Periweissella fabalis]